MGDFELPYDENCLTLNIWTPRADNEIRPVIVWIHGGAFVSGAGSLPWYNGTSFARDQGVVIVAVNYRLGALGFLCHPKISAGNLGLQDQMVALEWVRNNINSFGGDNGNVTLMGQSAGAISAYALLANKKARANFDKVILQSGRYDSFETLDTAAKKVESLADIAGVTPDALKTLSVEDILDAQSKLAQQNAEFAATNIPLMPVADGKIIPDDVNEEALIGAQGKKIMLGFAHDEMHAFLAGNPEIQNASDVQIEDVFKRDFGERWQEMLNYCRNRQPGATPMELLSLGLNEANFAGQTCNFATELSGKGIDTWLYRIDLAPPGSTYRACHCIELPFVFNTFDRWMPPMINGLDSAEARALSRVIQKTWGSFAANGDPNHEDLIDWPAYNSDRRSMIILNKHIETVIQHQPV
jgi:para-nitrobenzyl esterase